MAVTGTTGTSGTSSTPAGINFVDKNQTGFNSLNSESFLKLLITQLQNQDPLEPVGNDELLNQLSSMRGLQSNIEMGEALKAVTLNQRLSSGAAFIGKMVTGLDGQRNEISGVVDRVIVRDGNTFVGFGNNEVSVDNITQVNLATAE